MSIGDPVCSKKGCGRPGTIFSDKCASGDPMCGDLGNWYCNRHAPGSMVQSNLSLTDKIKRVASAAASFYKFAQITQEVTDPVRNALESANLGPTTIANNQEVLMPVILEMAQKGVPEKENFNIGLVIPQDKIPVYSVLPPTREAAVVKAALQQHITPLIQKVLKDVDVGQQPFKANQWIENLYWQT